MWALRRAIVFDRLEHDNLIRMHALRHSVHCGAISTAAGEAYKHHFDSAVEETRNIGAMLFPWANWGGGGDGKESEYRKAWEEWFGVQVGGAEWEEMERRAEMMQKWLKAKKD
jgi:hypothetical protein